jgi:hypothetical protein
MRRWKRRGVKLLGQCNLTQKGCQIERGGNDYQHQGGRVLGSNGMVNKCESLLNIVSTNKPKMLTGLSQKACGQEQMLQNHLPQTIHHRWKGET